MRRSAEQTQTVQNIHATYSMKQILDSPYAVFTLAVLIKLTLIYQKEKGIILNFLIKL